MSVLIQNVLMIVGGVTIAFLATVASLICWFFIKDYKYWRNVSKKSYDFSFDYPTDPFVASKEKPIESVTPSVEESKPISTVEDSVIVVPGPGEPLVIEQTQQTQVDVHPATQTIEPAKPQYLSAVSSVFRGWDKSTISACSVDPQVKLNEIYVAAQAVTEQKVVGESTFSESKTDDNSVKLVRSGTGFRIYDHPTLPDGKWLSCR